MNKFKLLLLATGFSISLFSQTDNNNGNWKERNVFKTNTTEADFMVRSGDIDNLGFGWEDNFNPFSGKSTNSHPYPWDRDSTEILGFDMIMVVSSMGKKDAPCGGEGYSGSREALITTYGKTTFPLTVSLKEIDTSKIKSVIIQMFVDDFQARTFCSKFEAYINSVRAPYIEKSLNAIDQTGPIGKLLTIVVPKDKLKDFKAGKVELLIDDNTTGAADGFAIDFIKILINPKVLQYGNVSGKLINEATGKPIANASIQCGGQTVKTNALGQYKLLKVPSGLAIISVEVPNKPEQNFTVDVEENSSVIEDLMFK
ncbi:MAG: hypothetical protein H0U95_11740 [Bacteroidetes bacterium]|nr:hypothetical protein [Bacteroidota bacterium]